MKYLYSLLVVSLTTSIASFVLFVYTEVHAGDKLWHIVTVLFIYWIARFSKYIEDEICK